MFVHSWNMSRQRLRRLARVVFSGTAVGFSPYTFSVFLILKTTTFGYIILSCSDNLMEKLRPLLFHNFFYIHPQAILRRSVIVFCSWAISYRNTFWLCPISSQKKRKKKGYWAVFWACSLETRFEDRLGLVAGILTGTSEAGARTEFFCSCFHKSKSNPVG